MAVPRLGRYGGLDEIALACATGVQESQGSASLAVVIPPATQHYRRLERNLLYAEVTRGPDRSGDLANPERRSSINSISEVCQ
jgi:hypothetical protein